MKRVTERAWAFRGQTDVPPPTFFSQNQNLAPLVARILWARGITGAEQVQSFLNPTLQDLPDPFLLKDMDKAACRVADALDRGETISIHGDYDVDGMTATSLLVDFLRSMGGTVLYFIPKRLQSGYGLSREDVRLAVADGAKLLISVDCGVSDVDEARLAAELGADLIVTDHHQVPEILPGAFALIDPHQRDCDFPDKDLAGVGVAFFLAIGVRKVLRDRGRFTAEEQPDLRQWLDMVALGTIADVVRLVGVNRILVQHGLRLIDQQIRPGVAALIKSAGLTEVTCVDVAFRLAPRMNAAGRIGNPDVCIELLLEDDREMTHRHASRLEAWNLERREVEGLVLEQAGEALKNWTGRHSIVLADERWHPGVIGIVASRLVEAYYRPVVLIAVKDGVGQGSARSIPDLHILDALRSCDEVLEGAGGHKQAAGLRVVQGNVATLGQRFDQVVGDQLGDSRVMPTLYYDAVVELVDINVQLLDQLDRLAPFGCGNPEPQFLSRALEVLDVSPVGSNHLRITVRQGNCVMPTIAFGMADRLGELKGRVDLLYTPKVNNWRGRNLLQLQVRDFRSA